MGDFAIYYCLAISIAGSLFLLFIGALCFIDYEYIALSNKNNKNIKGVYSTSDLGWTCMYAAGLYITISMLLLIYKAYKLRENSQLWSRLDSSSDEEITFTKTVKLKIK